jgi:hypothetical protein
MKTALWGPSAWRFLHAITFSYPENPNEDHKAAAVQLFGNVLKHLIPCADCCGHYCAEEHRDPIENHIGSRATLSKWLVALHNRVNSRLGKPYYKYADAEAEYLAEESQCASPEEPCSNEGMRTVRGDKSMSDDRSFANVAIMVAVVAATLILLWVLTRQIKNDTFAGGAMGTAHGLV